MTTDRSLSEALFFSALLVVGATLFAVVSIFKLDWFLPSMMMIVAAAIGWDRFVNEGRSPAKDRAVQSPNVVSELDIGGAGAEVLASEFAVPKEWTRIVIPGKTVVSTQTVRPETVRPETVRPDTGRRKKRDVAQS